MTAPAHPLAAGGAAPDPIPGRPDVEATFLALADPTRRLLIRRIVAGGPVTATELARGLPISRQAVAKHLALLRDAGLVSAEPRGRERRYRLTPRPLADAAGWLHAIEAEWESRLDALERHLAANPELTPAE